MSEQTRILVELLEVASEICSDACALFDTPLCDLAPDCAGCDRDSYKPVIFRKKDE